MSFQLTGNQVALLPIPVRSCLRKPTAVSASTPTSGRGISVTTPAVYKEATDAYKREEALFDEIDHSSSNWRHTLDTRASVLRAQFEALGAELVDLQDEYTALQDHDNETHDTRETMYDELTAKYNGLAPDDRDGQYRPSLPVQSQVNNHDTSAMFRDEDGVLTGPITEQVSDRQPDWLNTFTDVVGAVLDGWPPNAGDELSFQSPPTNELQRSRRALSKAVHDHTRAHIKETWRPAVMLGVGENLQQNVKCVYQWEDMYDPSVVDDLAPAVISEPLPINIPQPPPYVEEEAAAPKTIEATLEGSLEGLGLTALTEIGNKVEADLREHTIKAVAASSGEDVAVRAVRLAGVGWYK